MELVDLQKLAGITDTDSNSGSSFQENLNLSNKRIQHQKDHNIQPGTDEWFKLWFSRPSLTNENPFGNKKPGN